MSPSFTLGVGSTIFTMGSCFARNIEDHLVEWGCRVPVREFTLPREEYGADRPADTLTLYNTPTFRQEIEWAERIHARDGIVREEDCRDFLYTLDTGLTVDLGLNRVHASPLARCIERRQEIFAVYASAFAADCIVMTPGVSEAFRHRATGYYSNPTPVYRGEPLSPEDWELVIVDYLTAVDDLTKVIDLVRKHKPDTRFLITASPVPLFATFSGTDILTANTRSKAILRAACEAVAEARPFVDYFPSYEAVMLSSRRVWKADRRHVSDAFVRKIVSNLAAYYLPELGLPRPNAEFAELSLGKRILQRLGFSPAR